MTRDARIDRLCRIWSHAQTRASRAAPACTPERKARLRRCRNLIAACKRRMVIVGGEFWYVGEDEPEGQCTLWEEGAT